MLRLWHPTFGRRGRHRPTAKPRAKSHPVNPSPTERCRPHSPLGYAICSNAISPSRHIDTKPLELLYSRIFLVTSIPRERAMLAGIALITAGANPRNKPACPPSLTTEAYTSAYPRG